MPAYTVEDGLRVMSYLGLPLTEKEQALFREHYPKLYGTSDRFDFRGTLSELYSGILPFKAFPTDTVETEREAYIRHIDRDRIFNLAYELDLEPDLNRGTPLREIVGV